MGTDHGFDIRRARPQEAALLTDIAHRAKRHWGYPEETIRLWRDALTVTPADVERADMFVAVTGKRLHGFIALEPVDATTLEIHHLWVLPESMRRDIGRRLWQCAVNTCCEWGARRIECDADPNAEPFYVRMGMQRVGSTASIPAGRQLPRMRWQAPIRQATAPTRSP